ncbi:hypothetical protein [Photobacterium sp.]|uniref:hypothetical protein n=1 Tax=Photobacterium sp. TaxID=660 RepID=UPI00299E0BDE|nr:hypothetical protein [Photobacterium sp.]MDX1302287.1 hypothetical protein [Photobacterium sp.]
MTILITLGGWVDLFVFSVQFFLVNILLLWAVKITKPLEMNNYVKDYVTLFRRTGEVGFWNNKKLIKQDIKDFDSYSVHRRDRYMISSFDHDIRNRYSGKPIGVSFSTIECHASNNFIEWEFIRQYMDISQPLPDIPQLEYCRHLDPVTAEYDKKGKRRLPSGQKCPADFWRKMDKATFDKKYRKMFDNAGKDINWQKKRCILTDKLGTEI